MLEKDGVRIGILGEVCPKVLGNYRIGTRVYLAKLDCTVLYHAQKEEMAYHPLPKYPASTRDLSLVCDNTLPIAQIEKAIRAGAGKILEKLELFDVYRGDQVGKDQKSVFLLSGAAPAGRHPHRSGLRPCRSESAEKTGRNRRCPAAIKE